MSYQKMVFLVLTLLILCGGCGINEGVIQKEPKSFLLFSGNIQNAIVYIDDLAPIKLNKNFVTSDDGVGNTTTSSKNVHYAIAPGKHTIVVKKRGEDLVNRHILLGNGITKEIQIP